MSYDTSFDQIRLDQLANQYLSESDIHGQVLFSVNLKKTVLMVLDLNWMQAIMRP